MAQRHDGVRNLLTLLIGKVCTIVEVEPVIPRDQKPPALKSSLASGLVTALEVESLIIERL